MRRATLREILLAAQPDEAARLCGEIVRHQNRPPFDAAMIALGALLDGGDLGYDGHSRLYQSARALGDEQLARLLLSASPQPPGRPQPVPIPGIVELTLGGKKALA